MSAPQPERPMTVAPRAVAILRELVAQWEQAHAAFDFDGMSQAGAGLVGAVGAILAQHDATADGGS